MRVVINTCYGGFGLSHEAMLKLAEFKGIKVFPVKRGNVYWDYLVEEWDESMPEINKKYWNHNNADIARDDSELIRVIELMKSDANSDDSRLKVVDVPDGVEWYIHERDGREHVAEKHRIWS